METTEYPGVRPRRFRFNGDVLFIGPDSYGVTHPGGTYEHSRVLDAECVLYLKKETAGTQPPIETVANLDHSTIDDVFDEIAGNSEPVLDIDSNDWNSAQLLVSSTYTSGKERYEELRSVGITPRMSGQSPIRDRHGSWKEGEDMMFSQGKNGLMYFPTVATPRQDGLAYANDPNIQLGYKAHLLHDQQP
jgi:hypothetical protein